MRVSKKERDELAMFIADVANDVQDLKYIARLAVYSAILERHEHHNESVKITHKGLKEFITEVRSCESSQ